jgi:very-short-patch-repair endonuclease
MKRINPRLLANARYLRCNQTDVERLLWSRLRARQLHGEKFRRQYPVSGYIVDFCCPEKQLIVELDGGQHAQKQRVDKKRTAVLKRQGYRVLRFWNNEVIDNPDGVLARMAEYIDYPHTRPLPGREREKGHG